MSSFTAPLTVTKIIEREKKKFLWVIPYTKTKDYWITDRSFRYYVGEEGSDDYIDVPAGTKTDFASVPRWLWSIFPPDGPHAQAAVLHDHLYTTQPRPKYESDYIFLEAMTVLGTEPWRAKTMYVAVDKFGQPAWDKCERRLAEAKKAS